jgi:hypothetical protein
VARSISGPVRKRFFSYSEALGVLRLAQSLGMRLLELRSFSAVSFLGLHNYSLWAFLFSRDK